MSRGLRRVSRPSRGRRFPGTEDPKALARTRSQRCLIAFKRVTVERWVGIHPNKRLESVEMQHVCDSKPDAHHVVSKARGGHDRDTVALCRAAHSELHQMGPKAFCKRWGITL